MEGTSTNGFARIEGGYQRIAVRSIAEVWSRYQSGELRFIDVRVFFASQETNARRCTMKKGRVANITAAELRQLVNAKSEAAIRSSLRRLKRAGLEGNGNKDSLAPNEQAAAMLSLIENSRRTVPVPRRVLRLLSHTTRPVMMASILGHLLRCVYLRGQTVKLRGRVKASWIATVFGVDRRNVKAARGELERMGILERMDSPQWCLNRFGVLLQFNPAWTESKVVPSRLRTRSAETPPRPPRFRSETPPPSLDRKLLTDSKNQKPATRRPTGFREKVRGEPTWRNIHLEDLKDTARLERLFEQATESGWLERSENNRLLLFGAAEHALSVGTANPPGLFANLVSHRRWSFISQADEDRARRRIIEGRSPTHQRTPRDPMARIIPEHATHQSTGSRSPERASNLLSQLGILGLGITRPLRNGSQAVLR